MANKSLNRVVLMGNLTRDPELKYTPQGTAVCSFGLATNRSWTTQTGEIKEEVQFHRIVAWQKLAELCSKLLAKGRKVYIEGRIVYRNYTAKDGTPKSITEIIMNDFILFDDKYTKGLDEAVPSEEQNEHPAEVSSSNDFSIDEDLASLEDAPAETEAIKADEKKSKGKQKEEVKQTESADEKTSAVDDSDIPF